MRMSQPADTMRFHLGMDAGALWRSDEAWLSAVEAGGVTLMVSHGRLRRYLKAQTLKPANVDWVCDSRGFSELSDFGRWTITAAEYAAALRRYSREIGRLQWASPQDWMCEPFMLAKTGLTIAEHQARTVASVVELREMLAGDVHVIPVLQGWELSDYLRCVDLYRAAGIDLTQEPVVGLGSVCRRQSTKEIGDIVRALSALGLRLHGFGVKTAAMDQYGHLLVSADSFAWSKDARYQGGDCPHGVVKLERNCPIRALEWRAAVLAKLPAPVPAVAEQPAGTTPSTSVDMRMSQRPDYVTCTRQRPRAPHATPASAFSTTRNAPAARRLAYRLACPRSPSSRRRRRFSIWRRTAKRK